MKRRLIPSDTEAVFIIGGVECRWSDEFGWIDIAGKKSHDEIENMLWEDIFNGEH